MSIAAMNWVWEHSPTSGNERLVLLAIADCADDDGRNAWPSVTKLATKARLDPRTVQRVITRLQTAGHLNVERNAGRRGTNVYHLVIHTPRQNAAPGETPGRRSYAGGGVAQLRRGRGGAAVPPEPPVPPVPPPLARAGARARGPAEAPTEAITDGGGGTTEANTTGKDAHPPREGPPHDRDDASPFFAALGSDWPLSRSQRRRLTHRVGDALATGWSSGELAAHVGANTDGIRNPYAVLHTRLRDLPPPPHASRQPSRPPWCGNCVQSTRRLEGPDGTDLGRCPRCHPLTVGEATASGPARAEEGPR